MLPGTSLPYIQATMRKLSIVKPHNAGTPSEADAHTAQVADILALWSQLGAAGLTREAETLQPLLIDNARFVISLARQYQNQEVLVRAAHEAFIILLNQYAGRPDKLDKVMVLALRNSMVAVIQMQPGQQP